MTKKPKEEVLRLQSNLYHDKKDIPYKKGKEFVYGDRKYRCTKVSQDGNGDWLIYGDLLYNI